jgi:hypothetical protein
VFLLIRDLLLEETLSNDAVLLEQSAHAQFHLLWSVFKAHSVAEDTTIWPALKKKELVAVTAETELHGFVEDHAEEERCFEVLSNLLGRLRTCMHDKVPAVEKVEQQLI